MKTRTKVVLWLSVLWAIIAVLCWQSSASAWEIYRIPTSNPIGLIPWQPNYINGLVDQRGFVTTYIPIAEPCPPTGIIEYWVFQWNRMNSYNQVQTFTEMDRRRGDVLIFYPNAYGNLDDEIIP
jgi:hypothetical protein